MKRCPLERGTEDDAAAGTADHSVQLFDADNTMAEAVAEFLREGLQGGETVLVAASAPHWDAIGGRLLRQRCDVTGAIADGRLRVIDAAGTLASFMRRGWPDSLLFHHAVGSVVARLAGEGRPLRIFGEMVDLLVHDGNFVGARQLEQLWNRLAARIPFKLSCGYSSSHFGNPNNAADLREICQAHSIVQTSDEDELGAFLVFQHFVSYAHS